MRDSSWHSRPILAPFIYMMAAMLSGSLAYLAAFLLMGHIRYALCAMLITDVMVTLYLTMCAHKTEDGDLHV